MPTLRNGQHVLDRRLDRIRQTDLRSLNYPVTPTVDQYRAPRSRTWHIPIDPLNQGEEGSCAGHAWSHELAASPVEVGGVSHELAVDIYHGAQLRDPWPGGSYAGASPVYEGTSVLAAAQEVAARGYIPEYRWALSITDLILALGYLGPVVAGLDWTDGMFEPARDGYIRPTGMVAGGHCVCLIGIRARLFDGAPNSMAAIDPVHSYVTVLNSWGPEWGLNGRAKLALVDLAVLWANAEFCVPTARARPPV